MELTAGKALTTVAITGTGSYVKSASPTLSGTVAGSVTFSGANTHSGVANFTAAPTGFGIIPIGSIIPIAANLTGSHAIPATGVMDAAGWQYCDGAAISGSATMTGTIYNLTDERFIVGSTTAGSTGGTNTDSHVHTVDSQLSNYNAAHTHDYGHYHQAMRIESNGDTHLLSSSSPSQGTFTTSTHWTDPQSTGGGSGTWGAYKSVTTNFNAYTSGALVSGSVEQNTDSKLGTITLAHTHSTDSQDATNNRPLYVSAKYLMRVK